MKRLTTALVLGFSVLAAHAQTTFSFSGLEWGESVDQVDAKLAAANLPLSSRVKKIGCRVNPDCSLDFEGAVRGSVEFQGGRLIGVSVYSTNDATVAAERAVALQRRYGAPLPSKGSGRLMDDENLTSRWRSASGEALLIGPGGYINYSSGVREKAAAGSAVKF